MGLDLTGDSHDKQRPINAYVIQRPMCVYYKMYTFLSLR